MTARPDLSDQELQSYARDYGYTAEQIRYAWGVAAELCQPHGDGMGQGMNEPEAREVFRLGLEAARQQGDRGPVTMVQNAVLAMQPGTRP